MFRTSAMALLLASILVFPGQHTFADDDQASRIAELLRSPDRETRFGGINDVKRLSPIPAEVTRAMFDALRAEAIALGEPAQKGREAPESLPRQGDEISLVRVKANPADYIGKTFKIVGVARIADYWNMQYYKSEATHYSIQFSEQGGSEESAFLYLERDRGSAFADQLAKNAENGVRYTPLLATVTLRTSPQRAGDDWNMLELLDVQQLSKDQRSWQSPSFAGIDSIIEQMARCDKSSAPAFVEVIVPAAETTTDKALQALAVMTVAQMNKTAKAAVLPQLKKAERTAKSKEDRERLSRMIAVINSAPKKKGR